jgi:hypothetical protein
MFGTQNDLRHVRSITPQPHLHQAGREIQPYGTVTHLLPLGLSAPVRLEMPAQIKHRLADMQIPCPRATCTRSRIGMLGIRTW